MSSVGRTGEEQAARYCESLGWAVVDRNWRCELGELDLVCLEPVADGLPTGVAVEVKTRTGTGFGEPLEAITAAKLARLRRLAGVWAAQHNGEVSGVRLDGIGILKYPGWAPLVTHVRGMA